MNRVARWRLWLASVIVGQRPRSYRAVFVPPGAPWWKRWWFRTRPPTGYVPLAGIRPPDQPWLTTPDDELGVAVPLQHVLASGDESAVLLASCVAYTTGFQLGIGIRKRREPQPFQFPPALYEPPEMSLDVGVRFSDGREATTSHWHPGMRVDPPDPAGPVIGRRTGGGGGRRYDINFWVWPLPPDGPLTISCRWPAGAVPDGSVEVDGAAIRRAGLSSQKLWID